jgi:ketosteroid isomerase-like protein
MSEVENRNQSLVKAFFETLSTGNLERLRPLLHDQATWTVMAKGIPGAGEKKGRDVIIDEFLGPVRGLFEDGDPKVKIDRMICQGSFVAAETRGLGRLKNGKEYRNAYAFVIEIKGEKVFSLHEYMDSYYVSTLV